MRSERTGEHVGGLSGRAVVLRRSSAAFAVGLDDEAAEVGNELIDLVRLGLPPANDIGVERIEGVEAAVDLRAGEIDGERESDAPGAEGIRDAGDLREHFGSECAEIRVDVVDGDRVDAGGGEEASILRCAREIVANVTRVKEDAATRVAALDGA